jgi:hypothetical protein
MVSMALRVRGVQGSHVYAETGCSESLRAFAHPFQEQVETVDHNSAASFHVLSDSLPTFSTDALQSELLPSSLNKQHKN